MLAAGLARSIAMGLDQSSIITCTVQLKSIPLPCCSCLHSRMFPHSFSEQRLSQATKHLTALISHLQACKGGEFLQKDYLCFQRRDSLRNVERLLEVCGQHQWGKMTVSLARRGMPRARIARLAAPVAFGEPVWLPS